MIINTPETVPKSTPHLAAPPSETQPSAHSASGTPALPAPVFHDPKHHIKIFQGDCLDILASIPASCVDLIFADLGANLEQRLDGERKTVNWLAAKEATCPQARKLTERLLGTEAPPTEPPLTQSQREVLTTRLLALSGEAKYGT